MNIQEMDFLLYVASEQISDLQSISDMTGYSSEDILKSVNNLRQLGFLDSALGLTDKAQIELEKRSPKRAIILAAGFGMRMIPINRETPKALLEVKGEPIIERTIKLLHMSGINEILIVVGFLKEKFEYLIDKYGVELIYNAEYSSKNNLYSLALVSDRVYNTYIIPADIWCNSNPFSRNELYSWYMVSNMTDEYSNVRTQENKELVIISENNGGNSMIGITYLTGHEAETVRCRLKLFSKDHRYNDSFWEESLYENDHMIAAAKVVQPAEYVEINTYEQLRELDESSAHLKSDAIEIVSKVLGRPSSEIIDISVLKKGMTNRSFLFSCQNEKFIMRIPGEGTDKLIDRKAEAEVYKLLEGKGICDDVVYINPDNGYKITKFIENSRVCDVNNEADLFACMKKLREFHQMNLSVDHVFDIFQQIEFYESLWDGNPSIYKDYLTTKMNIFALQGFINENVENICLTHIDAVPDNFLFTSNGDVILIDWEYSGMQDPHVDIAMFCIYALYDQNQVDKLIDIYFENNCQKRVRQKIYCYIAACGLLWSNWCEYKRNLGVEFGEYSLRQYRYAKEYCKLFKEGFNESR